MEKENSQEDFPITNLGNVGIKILITIYSSKEKMKYIRQITSDGRIGYTSAYRALSVLADYGLVYYKNVYGRKFIVLTSIGEKIAKLLTEANNLIKESKNKRLSEIA